MWAVLFLKCAHFTFDYKQRGIKQKTDTLRCPWVYDQGILTSAASSRPC